MKHTWFRSIRHFLWGHQILWGSWVEMIGFDGCSIKGRCKYCGYEGLIDSQMNLF